MVRPEEAVQFIQSNMRVYIHPGCPEPETLVEALMARGPFVRNVEIVHLMTTGRADYIAPQMEGHFRHNAMFVGPNVRQAVNDGRADYTPVFLSQVEDCFESGQMLIDVPAAEIADCPDATKAANMVLLGALLELTHALPKETSFAVLKSKVRNAKLLEVDCRAIDAGMECIRTQLNAAGNSAYFHFPSPSTIVI